MSIPNFFIVGAPKAGTTSLYNYLEEHPEVFMSEIKETNYFSYNEINSQNLFYNEEKIRTLEEYLSLFKPVKGEKAIGEASVSYLFYKKVPKSLYEFNPESKIIMVLRNPIDRGFSHYLMDTRLGLVNYSYDDIVDKNVEDKSSDLFYQQYVELGLYYNQVKRYLDVFGPDKVKIILFEDMVDDISKVVKDIFRFLEVDNNFTPQLKNKYNTYKEPKNIIVDALYKTKGIRKLFGAIIPNKFKGILLNTSFKKEKKPTLSDNTRTKLKAIYKDDIINLESLLYKDLKSWYN